MNNNTKLFGVLVAALFAFGAIGTSAQNGFNTFVELGDWEYDIGDSNVFEYCTLEYDGSTNACVIYTTNAAGDYSKGDLYLGPEPGASDIEEGFVRLFNTHGFDAGTLVQDGDADEGASIFEAIDGTQKTELSFIQSVADGKLQNAELAAFFISKNETATNPDTVQEDDVFIASGERIDDDHDLIDAELVRPGWKILFADLDGGGTTDHDEGEPLFADVDGSDTVTVGDLILSGDGFFSLVALGDPYLANPALIGLNNSAANPVADRTAAPHNNYFLAILDEQADYNENGYRGESILLVRNTSGEDLDAPRVGEYSYVLTGDRQGELVKDGHPFHEEEFASITVGQMPVGYTADAPDDQVVLCALVGDADDDPVSFVADVFFHFDDTDCGGNDADAGDVNVVTNSVLNADADGELSSFINDTDIFNQTLWFVLDLNHDGDVDAGEPIVLDADASGTLTSLDLVFTTDGAFLAGPGYNHMAPDVKSVETKVGAATVDTFEAQFCTYYEEEEDENGNDVWVAYAVMLRAQYWSDVTDGEGPCSGTGAEEDVLMGDFVLAGDMHVGEFLTESNADDFGEGEYSTESGAGQKNYTVYFDDLFPSGFGPEDTVFLVSSGKPKLDEASFYLGGPAVREGDDYYFTNVADLVAFSSPADYHFVLIEGDTRKGLSEADWFYLTYTPAGTINDETLILYKGAGADGGTPTTTPTVTPTVTPTTEPTTEPTTPTEPTKKQPGFEAVALIAALGAALVLVRRRN